MTPNDDVGDVPGDGRAVERGRGHGRRVEVPGVVRLRQGRRRDLGRLDLARGARVAVSVVDVSGPVGSRGRDEGLAFQPSSSRGKWRRRRRVLRPSPLRRDIRTCLRRQLRLCSHSWNIGILVMRISPPPRTMTSSNAGDARSGSNCATRRLRIPAFCGRSCASALRARTIHTPSVTISGGTMPADTLPEWERLLSS